MVFQEVKLCWIGLKKNVGKIAFFNNIFDSVPISRGEILLNRTEIDCQFKRMAVSWYSPWSFITKHSWIFFIYFLDLACSLKTVSMLCKLIIDESLACLAFLYMQQLETYFDYIVCYHLIIKQTTIKNIIPEKILKGGM